MDLNLKGKYALVCGSSQGIGMASAIELASLGANVVLMARNEKVLKQVSNALPKNENNHDFIVADFSKPKQLKEILEKYLQDNKIDFNILVNNTGGPAGGQIIDASTESFENTFSQHLINNHIITQALVEGMKRTGYGRIINIISTSVKQPLNGLGVSNTIRGAVASWSKTMANELGVYGITVNNVLPGATDTVRLRSIIENKATKTGLSEDEVSKMMIAQVPLQRFADAKEIAYAVGFLASPSAAYINGVNIPVDGGRTKCL
ncbi:MAG: SDR family oxidoreductase [Flavobacteriaceae bacterium]|nr:SDR family oxidoreductase [Flavobacteriaceae bacterium]